MPEPLTPDELDYSTVRLGERASDGEVYCGAGHPIPPRIFHTCAISDVRWTEV